MRVAIAGFCMESASFLPVVHDWQEFEPAVCRGAQVIERHRGCNTTIGGFLEVCEREGVEPQPVLYADGGAGGPVTDAVFDRYGGEICDGLRAMAGHVDGVLLHLHGASATPRRVDPDAELARMVREAVGPDLPVIVAFDYHGNLSAQTIAPTTAVFGYRRSPHTDMAETGRRAGACLVRTVRGEITPVMAIARPDLMVPSVFSATDLRPLKGIMAAARDCGECSEGYLDVSVFAGFAYADAPNTGFSVVAVADGDPDLARSTVEALSDEIRDRRHALYAPQPTHTVLEAVDTALHRARTTNLPIVLVEHADRLNDSTYVLRELIRRRVRSAAVPFLWDREAATAAVAAGVGAHVRLSVGGRSGPRAGGPVTLEGRVVFAEPDLRYRTTGPMATGRLVELGSTAVIDADGLIVSVTSRSVTAVDEDCFVQFGMRARDFDLIVLRSKTHFRAVYEALAAEILIVDTPDYGPADLRSLPYRHVPRERVFPFADPED